jgi:hypothetical protein
LDQEREAAKIKLANERDFYPRICFERYLQTSDGLTHADRIFEFMSEYPCEDIGQVAPEDVRDFVASFTSARHQIGGRQKSEELNQLKEPLVMNYDDFLALMSPMNRDFTELMLQRQQDLDLQEQEASYIRESVLSNQKKGEVPCLLHQASACRLARPYFNYDKEGHFSHVPALISETFLSLILNFQRNKEIRKTYDMATKGQHVGSDLLSFLPTSCGINSDHITAADLLHFVALDKSDAFAHGNCHGLTLDHHSAL